MEDTEFGFPRRWSGNRPRVRDEPPAAPEPAMPEEPQTSIHEQSVPPVPDASPPDEEAASETPDDDVQP